MVFNLLFQIVITAIMFYSSIKPWYSDTPGVNVAEEQPYITFLDQASSIKNRLISEWCN